MSSLEANSDCFIYQKAAQARYFASQCGLLEEFQLRAISAHRHLFSISAYRLSANIFSADIIIWNPLIWKYRRIFCKHLFWWDTHTDTLDRFYILGCWHRREWLVPRIDLISFNKSTIPRKLDSLFQNCNCFNINQIIKKAKRNKFLS